ncbi:MAG: hypothetical protein WC732_01395 [Candidatus Omnitrophota bacterium]
MRKWYFMVMAALVLSFAGAAACLAETAEEKAVKTAKEAALKEGVAIAEAELIYDPSNQKWEERVVAIEALPADPNHGNLPHGMLQNRKYETVLLDFKEGATEADTWVFLDKDTGDVLAIYQEK